MHRFVLATLCAIIVTASAAPVLRHGDSNGRHNLKNSNYPARDSFCMTDTDAQEVASTYAQVITNYTEALVNETFAVDFQDWSSSTNYLVSESCNAPMPIAAKTFDSRADFEAGQDAQPRIPFEITNVWHGCDSVTLRWTAALTPQEVIGVAAIETQQTPTGSKYSWQVKNIYSEFNAGAYLVNLGVYTPTCALPDYG